jgi:hypothetical protein
MNLSQLKVPHNCTQADVVHNIQASTSTTHVYNASRTLCTTTALDSTDTNRPSQQEPHRLTREQQLDWQRTKHTRVARAHSHIAAVNPRSHRQVGIHAFASAQRHTAPVVYTHRKQLPCTPATCLPATLPQLKVLNTISTTNLAKICHDKTCRFTAVVAAIACRLQPSHICLISLYPHSISRSCWQAAALHCSTAAACTHSPCTCCC